MNADKIQINKLLFVGLIVTLIFLFIFYNDNKDAADQIVDLKQNISVLETQNQELQFEIQRTKGELDQCNKNLKELEEETTTLLGKYLLEEAFWDFIGAKKLRLLCGIAKIKLREEIPNIRNLPC